MYSGVPNKSTTCLSIFGENHKINSCLSSCQPIAAHRAVKQCCLHACLAKLNRETDSNRQESGTYVYLLCTVECQIKAQHVYQFLRKIPAHI